MTGESQLVKHLLYHEYNRHLLAETRAARPGRQPTVGAYLMTPSRSAPVSRPCIVSKRRW